MHVSPHPLLLEEQVPSRNGGSCCHSTVSMAFATPVTISTSLADQRFAFTPISTFRKHTHLKRTPPERHTCLLNRRPIFTRLESQQKYSSANAVENGSIKTLQTDNISDKHVRTTPEYNPPIFQVAYDLFRRIFRNVELGRLYGPVYKTNGLFGAITMITDYDAIVEISRKPHLFTVDGAFPLQTLTIMGKDVMAFVDGDKHKTARAHISPAFLPSTIPSFHGTIVNHARDFFLSLTDKIVDNSTPVNAIDIVKNYFLDLIIKLTVNANLSDKIQRSRNSHDYDANSKKLDSMFIQFANAMVMPAFMPAYKRGVKASINLETELRSILLHRLRDKNTRLKLRNVRDCLLNGKVAKVLSSGRADLMSILIATSSLELSENDDEVMFDTEEDNEEISSIARIVRFLWFAGFSTQTGALLCVIMEIFSDPALLKQLQDEQDSIPNLTAHSVANDMPLLTSTLTESLRLNSAVSLLFRCATEDIVVLQHLIPKGTVVGMDFRSANMDRTVFQNPDDFIPDRFVNKPELARKAFLFGAAGSAHYCIGASLAMATLRTTLAVMIREFDVDVKPWKVRSVTHFPDALPRGGVWVRSCAPKRPDA